MILASLNHNEVQPRVYTAVFPEDTFIFEHDGDISINHSCTVYATLDDQQPASGAVVFTHKAKGQTTELEAKLWVIVRDYQDVTGEEKP